MVCLAPIYASEALSPVSNIVNPSVGDSTSPMLVDEPVLAESISASPNGTVSVASHVDAPLLPLSTSPSHTSVFATDPPSTNSISVTSPAAPLSFVFDHHVPTMPSFTFGIDKNMPSMTVSTSDREVSPFSSLTVQDPYWSFHLPQVTSTLTWNMIDNAPITPESNPWQNVRSMASPQFHHVVPPSMPTPGPLEPVAPQMPFIAPEIKTTQWPYSTCMPLLLSPSPSYTLRHAESGLTSTTAAAFSRSHTEAPAANEADTAMNVDDPMPIEERPVNTPAPPLGVVEREPSTSTSETHAKNADATTGFIPWRAPSLRKRVHLETMNDAQSSQPRWSSRDDSQSPEPFGERRESKRLKCATCMECNAHNAPSILGKNRKESWRGRTVKKRASKADLADDWRLRRKPVLLGTNAPHTEFGVGLA
jgi:hypothetical protein